MIFSMMVLIFCAFFVHDLSNEAELVTIRKMGGVHVCIYRKKV